MERAALTELHYIAPIRNLPSILRLGILSHARMRDIPHASVAEPEIQQRRAQVRIPGGRRLHEYVNLYINARNAMLRRLQDRNTELCVLRVNPNALDLPGVIIADKNAAASFVKFLPSPEGLLEIDRDLMFKEFWTDPNKNEYVNRLNRQKRQAEILVPDRVAPTLIMGAYVSCSESQILCRSMVRDLPTVEDPHLFML